MEKETKIKKKNIFKRYPFTTLVLGFLGLLTLLFIGLKLSNIIDWSWFWILSPILLLLMITIVIGLFYTSKKMKYLHTILWLFTASLNSFDFTTQSLIIWFATIVIIVLDFQNRYYEKKLNGE